MEREMEIAEPTDAAAQAFEALRREVALLSAAIGGLAAERSTAPDYSESLGEIAQQVSLVAGRVGKLGGAPALQVTPEQLAQQIAKAGAEARRLEQTALESARTSLERATTDLCGTIGEARQARAQNLRLLQTGAAALVVGALLGAVIPGVVADRVPASWAWPEHMAANRLHRNLWSAGERLLSVADPERWRRLQAAAAAPPPDASDPTAASPSRSAHLRSPGSRSRGPTRAGSAKAGDTL